MASTARFDVVAIGNAIVDVIARADDALITAEGLTNPLLAGAAPYDLLIANILAGPLTQLAPSILRSLAPGAVLLLSGLLTNQEKLVTSFYQGLRFVGVRRSGPWSALVLEKPAR